MDSLIKFNNIKFNNRQKNLYDFIRNSIKNNKITNVSFLFNPIGYIFHKINQLLFGKKNTVHESCITVTENLYTHIISQGVPLEDYINVITVLEQKFIQEANHTCPLLYTIYKQFMAEISQQIVQNMPEEYCVGDIEQIITHGDDINCPVDLRDIKTYECFIFSILNNRNSTELYEEATKVLNTVYPLTTLIIIMRGLAYAIHNIVNPTKNDKTIQSNNTEFDEETYYTIVLNITAITQSTRESNQRFIEQKYKEVHPWISKAHTFVTYVNSHLQQPVSFAYLVGILSTFTTRWYYEYAVGEFQNDINNSLAGQVFNITFNKTAAYNRSYTYQAAFEQMKNGGVTLSTLPTYSSQQNLTELFQSYQKVNTTIYMPAYTSEYFRDYDSAYTGFPSYITTCVGLLQLAFISLNILTINHRKKFILNAHKSQYSNQLNDIVLVALTMARMCNNVGLQLTDVFTSEVASQFFKWSVLRFFTPISFAEEHLKTQLIYNGLQKYSYNTKSIQLNLCYISTATVAILILEYLNTWLLQPMTYAGTYALKFVRVVAVYVPIFSSLKYSTSRCSISISSTLHYNKTFRNAIYVNTLKALNSPITLPLFDQFGGRIMYLNLLQALDVLVTVLTDLVSAHLLSDISAASEAMLTIDNVINASLTRNKNMIAILSQHMNKLTSNSGYTLTIKNAIESNYINQRNATFFDTIALYENEDIEPFNPRLNIKYIDSDTHSNNSTEEIVLTDIFIVPKQPQTNLSNVYLDQDPSVTSYHNYDLR